MGRIMAIDYGRKRVGLAVTDELQLIATGLDTVPAHTIFDYLRDYLSRENVDLFVVGKPTRLDNTPSEAQVFTEPFVKKLRKLFPTVPVERIDERFTSGMASRAILEAGAKKKDRQRKDLIDKVSATIILQSFMESKAYRS
ncbi:MAG TPA: Holliday junction resolvase RuvX [Bacteroidales bacterium]|nr:Holliday junction resolvase RuvX [Bacteroidales bacterium]